MAKDEKKQPEDKPAAGEKTYICNWKLRLDGKSYAAKDEVTLTAAQAKKLGAVVSPK